MFIGKGQEIWDWKSRTKEKVKWKGLILWRETLITTEIIWRRTPESKSSVNLFEIFH